MTDLRAPPKWSHGCPEGSTGGRHITLNAKSVNALSERSSCRTHMQQRSCSPALSKRRSLRSFNGRDSVPTAVPPRRPARNDSFGRLADPYAPVTRHQKRNNAPAAQRDIRSERSLCAKAHSASPRGYGLSACMFALKQTSSDAANCPLPRLPLSLRNDSH